MSQSGSENGLIEFGPDNSDIDRLAVESALLRSPCTCEPICTSMVTPAQGACLWAHAPSGRQPSSLVASLQEQNDQLLRQLRDSVSRVRELSQAVSGHRRVGVATSSGETRGVLNELHVNDTPARGVSMQERAIFTRESQALPSGQFEVPEASRPSGAGAQISRSMVTGGRAVTIDENCP